MNLNVQKLAAHDRREISRFLSSVDQESTISASTWTALWKHARQSTCPVIGIAGPPGAGKSSLIGKLLEMLPSEKKVLVLCIDPSSVLTGGAVLGDRIRMDVSTLSPNVFIRSLGSHGAAGGICPSLERLILVGKAAGFELIFVEGVGSGQSDVALKDYVDSFCVIVVPESGDEVQSMKAGHLEMADIVVLNKSDRPESDLAWGQLTKSLFDKKLVRTSVITSEGLVELRDVFLSVRPIRNQREFSLALRAALHFLIPLLELEARSFRPKKSWKLADRLFQKSDLKKRAGTVVKSLAQSIVKRS